MQDLNISRTISNYRLISLLPSISKILEKVIFKQLSTYLNEHTLLYDSQYGSLRSLKGIRHS